METEISHRLLKRQYAKAFPGGKHTDEGLQKLLLLVDKYYCSADEERTLTYRAQEISSKEVGIINAKLEEKNMFLDSFNHGLAHDVKNHTANFKGLLSMLRKYYKLDNQKMMDTIVDKLDTSISQMTTIIDGFLYLSRAEGKLDSNLTLIDSTKLKENISIETEYLISNSEHNLSYDIEVDGLYYSSHILRIILVNLISNSIKFCKPGIPAQVDIKIGHDENFVYLWIKDNGIGMDLKDPDNKMFTLFNRENVKVKGYGVGLFMIKKILDYNKGIIELKSEPNKGTEIHIKLPLA